MKTAGVVKGAGSILSLKDEYPKMNVWYNFSLPVLKKDFYYNTVAEFYEKFIDPILPDKESVIKWTKLLLEYTKQDNAIFSVRAFHDWKKVKNSSDSDQKLAIKMGIDKDKDNPYSLRRGFLTEFKNSKHKYFFNDNFFAAYFMKMAFDGFVPDIKDLLTEMQQRTFPARFGQCCKEEKAIAAYNIAGKKAKDPGIQTKGYKIGHVIDSGRNYQAFRVSLDKVDICDRFFPRGNYQDWKSNGAYFSRVQPSLDSQGLEYLKAHFLRFACPINYFLAPKANYRGNVYQQYGSDSKFETNKPDIAELPELQEYIIGKFYKLYGEVYVEYLNAIMWRADVANELENILSKMDKLGQTVIDLTVYYPAISTKPITRSSKAHVYKSKTKVKKSSTPAGSPKIGELARTEFKKRIPSFPSDILDKLQDKDYCKNEFNINYPVLSKSRVPKNRYYKDHVNGYYICKEWYESYREKTEDWLLKH